MKKSQARLEPVDSSGGFTISEIEDGKRSVAKHLRGRRASANVLFVPKTMEATTKNDENSSENQNNDLIDSGYTSDKPLFLQVCFTH